MTERERRFPGCAVNQPKPGTPSYTPPVGFAVLRAFALKGPEMTSAAPWLRAALALLTVLAGLGASPACAQTITVYSGGRITVASKQLSAYVPLSL